MKKKTAQERAKPIFKRLFVDQYGDKVYASTVKELREKCYGGRVQRIFHDTDGAPIHIGYSVGDRWFTEYQVAAREM